MCLRWLQWISIGAILAIPAMPVRAQQAAPAEPAGANPDVATLVIVAQVEERLQKPDIRLTFEQALQNAPKPGAADPAAAPARTPFQFNLQGIDIKRVDRKAFSEVAALIAGRKLVDEGSYGPLTMERDEKEQKDWILNLGSKDFFLEKITVAYVDENKKETEKTYETQVVGSTTGLRAQRPGVYILSLDGPGKPHKYKAVIFNSKTDKNEEVQGGWPLGENFFMISLPEFSGSIDQLVKTLSNSDGFYVAEPFKIDDVAPASVMLARFGAVKGTIGKGWKQNTYTIGFGPLTGKRAERVWMRFPLTEAQAKEDLAKLVALKTGDGSPTLAQIVSSEIRKTSPAGTRPYTLKPADGPQWYEVPALYDTRVDQNGATQQSISGYEAAFMLEDIRGWKQVKEPPSWRLVVFEYDVNGQQQALLVNHSKTGDQVLIVDELDEDFSVGIRDLETPTDPKAAPAAPVAPATSAAPASK